MARVAVSASTVFDGLLTHAGHSYYAYERGQRLAIANQERDVMVGFAGRLRAAGHEVTGISILACGIGSLRNALGGDRETAEAGNQEVLAQALRVGVADMITADAEDVEDRIAEGFLALLMQGPEADRAIRIGRVAAGRQTAESARTSQL